MKPQARHQEPDDFAVCRDALRSVDRALALHLTIV